MRHTALGAAVGRETEGCQSAAVRELFTYRMVIVRNSLKYPNIKRLSVPRVGAEDDLPRRCSTVVQLSDLLA